jgi:DNA adenine methylase
VVVDGRVATLDHRVPPGSVRPVAPLVKWPGGKTGELDRIRRLLPGDVHRYLEPFVGGGAVLFSLPPDVPAHVNDACVELMDLYAGVRAQDPALFTLLDGLVAWWEALAGLTEQRADGLVRRFASGSSTARVEAAAVEMVERERAALLATVPAPWSAARDEFLEQAHRILPRKLARMRTVEAARGQSLLVADVWSNIEGAVKAACYTALRARYNRGRAAGTTSPMQSALFFFLREYAYAAMFRFNADGGFNVPYGGVSYNRKSLAAKVDHLRSPAVADRLRATTLACEDFETFLERHRPGPDDVVFLDPPYDSDFSEYDGNGFGRHDHERLASVLRRTPARFVLVIKATPAVLEVYRHDAWYVASTDQTYRWTIKGRNDRRATHLTISNFAPPAAAPPARA